MKKIKILIIILFFAATKPALARPVIADLSLRQIEIDAGFTGTDILLFGARNDPGNLVVVIRGPLKSYIIRKKERVFGLWMNKKQVVYNNINGFYAMAASMPLSVIHNDYLLESLHIGEGNASLPSIYLENEKNAEFTQAFLKKQQSENLYAPTISEISLLGDTLFRTVINFPANILRGVYTAEIYLFSDGGLSAIQSTPIIVSKKGFAAFMYDFAYKYPLFYGIIAVTIALLAGWLAGLVFRRV